MAIRIGRRIPNWMILAITGSVVSVGLLIAGLNKPLPEYLIATESLRPGSQVELDTLSTVKLDLGPASSKYLLKSEFEIGSSVVRVVREGELLARADMTFATDPSQTAIRLVPALKPAQAVRPGARVSVWQVVETEEGPQAQRLVSSAEVLDLIYGEGLFAAERPEVEIRVSIEQSLLIMTAVSSKFDIYLLPLS
jgi:hypothetical protein